MALEYILTCTRDCIASGDAEPGSWATE